MRGRESSEGGLGGYTDIPILTDSGGDAVSVRARLALTDSQRKRGLMFERELPQDSGMVFLYEKPGARALWMKDTFVPLDAGWFTPDGVLRQVVSMSPEDLTPHFSTESDITVALEVPQGFFGAHGLVPGRARLDLAALRMAVDNSDDDGDV